MNEKNSIKLKEIVMQNMKLIDGEYDENSLNLWASVMTQAIDDLNDRNENIKEKTKVWFNSNNTEIGSCRWICQLFNLEYNNVCKKVLN